MNVPRETFPAEWAKGFSAGLFIAALIVLLIDLMALRYGYSGGFVAYAALLLAALIPRLYILIIKAKGKADG